MTYLPMHLTCFEEPELLPELDEGGRGGASSPDLVPLFPWVILISSFLQKNLEKSVVLLLAGLSAAIQEKQGLVFRYSHL